MFCDDAGLKTRFHYVQSRMTQQAGMGEYVDVHSTVNG
jgi:hypothetical protein